MKCSKTLSSIRTKSSINNLLSFHSSKYSKFTEDKQHTAVLSFAVGNVISEHKFEWLNFNPSFFWDSGSAALTVSINEMYGSPVAILVSRILIHKVLASIVLITCLVCGSIKSQASPFCTASIKASVILIP